MVKLGKIYTRTGDEGTTGLTGGTRVPKYDIRVEAYGAVDEANSCIGLARLHTRGEHDEFLRRIQHDLFDLGADLSTPISGEGTALRITDKQVHWLEEQIDAMNAHLQPLNSFVLPGGSPLAANLHLARTVVRRAERRTCMLAEKEPMNLAALRYLNRLSDFLFVLSRIANNNGDNDVLWQPGVNR
ncbi:MAG: cob(I)yrinic acid a,c-diamide adenosyltransferase [Alphaproteobacteria bacterium]